jgi:transcriptional regulator with XRE-family HTH domain
MGLEIFATLKQYGINLSGIARTFGVSRMAVSRWARGLRTMSPAVERDLEALAGLVVEYVQQGREARDALQAWRPRSVVTEGGGWPGEPVAQQSGPINLDSIKKAFLEAPDVETRDNLLLQHILDQIDAIRTRPLSELTMTELIQLRHLSAAFETMTATMVQRKAQELQPPREEGT